ncbi:MAG: hypothetical protein JJ902_12175 [Roseibium sp.]|nr:hypothetical protein [Roseibium sp.]
MFACFSFPSAGTLFKKIHLVRTSILALALLAAPLPIAAQPVSAQAPNLDTELAALSSDQLEELFTFVAGNALFTLYHEAGHMLVSELELPILGQEEDAVDNLATVTMLGADTEDMDILLINAMVGWFLIAEDTYEDLIFYGEHDLDQQRGFQTLCLMVGADPDVFQDLAVELGLPEDRIERCVFDYEQAADSWEAITDPYLRAENTTGDKISVSYGDAPAGLGTMALFLRESMLMENVAKELDDLYELPVPVTFTATACGVENAYWDPGAREMTLCYELVEGFAWIYLDVLAEPDDTSDASALPK